MPHPFEEPRKRDLRERAAIALDAAGYEVAEQIEPIDPPPELALQGKILGDLQARDQEDARYVVFVRTDPRRPVPQWIANSARAAHRLEAVYVYVIAEESTPALEQSARACGAGLLILPNPGTLTEVIDPRVVDPAIENQALAARAKRLRRRLETKLELLQASSEEDFAQVGQITAPMPQDVGGGYLSTVEEEAVRFREWGEEMSLELDRVAADPSPSALGEVERAIELGPQR